MSRALWFYPRAKQLRRVGGCVAPASLMELWALAGLRGGGLARIGRRD
ncbi:hypothetical protein [Synechococcus sp. PCC 7336]|nr:hypothetical protein [Synechococcus sp. PCC 7336]